MKEMRRKQPARCSHLGLGTQMGTLTAVRAAVFTALRLQPCSDYNTLFEPPTNRPLAINNI